MTEALKDRPDIERKALDTESVDPNFLSMRDKLHTAWLARPETEATRILDLDAYPKAVQELVNKKLSANENFGITDKEQLKKLKSEFIGGVRNTQFFERGGVIYNGKESVKDKVREVAVKALLEKDFSVLETYARVSIDINGLKAVNDIANHNKGDEFLNKVTIRLKEIETRLKEQYPEILEAVELSVEGGD